MAIQNEIERIRSNIRSAYEGLAEKGAVIPTNQNSENLANTIESIAVIPSGAILLFYGLESKIPSGYQVCNGSNGTPDLRDSFVVTGKTNSTNGVSLVVNEEYSFIYIMKI